MQNQNITDRRILVADGYRFSDITDWPEGGYDEDPVEVMENGQTVLIGSNQEKAKARQYTMLTKRNSKDFLFLMKWRDSGKFAKDVVEYYTDKSGDILNSHRSDSYPACELGSIIVPATTTAATDPAKVSFTLLPGDKWKPDPNV